MAKSLRSKWKKKMRAIKRVRYGQKELEKLKQILATDTSRDAVNMTNISDIVTVTDAQTVCQEAQDAGVSTAGEMDVDKTKKYNRKTMKDEDGKYPTWLSKRRIKQLSLANKRAKKAKRTGKKTKSGGKLRRLR